MRYLALDEVLALHAEQVRRFGGSPGLRDRALLESALAVPRATFDGEPLHPTVFEAAAAYLFHVARNHPFVDGNKRTALAAALVFLWLNGYRLECDDEALGDLVLGVASGKIPKSEIAVFLKRHAAALA
ncbi:MAG: type II toxin-antitoxin system death-on-curing family toxin [Thermoanaerobaculia bacterium]|nr:MAG: type II toxin-antitoxin system death-on-curing family toxin [Thermoanaerobaculia bacterium]